MVEKNDILSGFHSIYEALKSDKRKFEKIIISKKRSLKRVEKLERLARKKKIKIEFADPGFLDRISEYENHQGIIARTSFYPLQNALEIIPDIKNRQKEYFILVLESIEDPHNLGALIRSAVCAGVDYIFIPKNRCAPPSSSVSRISAGAMEHANIFMITNTASILRTLKEIGFWISGLDAKGTVSLFDSDLKGDIALVIGGEHKGIRPGVKKECDFLLSIPNCGNINSLNASVAGSIAMYEVLRQTGLK